VSGSSAASKSLIRLSDFHPELCLPSGSGILSLMIHRITGEKYLNQMIGVDFSEGLWDLPRLY
jgi:hypothetical protein